MDVIDFHLGLLLRKRFYCFCKKSNLYFTHFRRIILFRQSYGLFYAIILSKQEIYPSIFFSNKYETRLLIIVVCVILHTKSIIQHSKLGELDDLKTKFILYTRVQIMCFVFVFVFSMGLITTTYANSEAGNV